MCIKKVYYMKVLLNARCKYGIQLQEYGLLVKRLRRRPLTAETGVRFPYKLLCIFVLEEWAYVHSFVFALELKQAEANTLHTTK